MDSKSETQEIEPGRLRLSDQFIDTAIQLGGDPSIEEFEGSHLVFVTAGSGQVIGFLSEGIQSVATDWAVEAMPTFMFLKEGKIVDKVIGAKKEELQQTIAKHLATASA